MIDSMQMLTVIKDTLEKMGSKYASHDAQMLVYRTGLVESKYQYIMQKGGSNIATGFWQCEPWEMERHSYNKFNSRYYCL